MIGEAGRGVAADDLDVPLQVEGAEVEPVEARSAAGVVAALPPERPETV